MLRLYRMLNFIVTRNAKPLNVEAMFKCVSSVMMRLWLAIHSTAFATIRSNNPALSNLVMKRASCLVSFKMFGVAFLVGLSEQIFAALIVCSHLRFEFLALWSSIFQVVTFATNAESAVKPILARSESVKGLNTLHRLQVLWDGISDMIGSPVVDCVMDRRVLQHSPFRLV